MDQLDLRILQALQEDGRRPNADLAREFGVAPSTTLERIRRLEEQGTLQGFGARIDRRKLGLNVQAMVSITLAKTNAEAIRPFEEGIRSIPFVRACYHISGRFDYLVYLAARDLDHLGQLVKARIGAIPGVARTETFLVFSEIKSDRGWPVELCSAEEDIDKSQSRGGNKPRSRR